MKCNRCGSTDNLQKISKSPNGIQYYICKKCNTERCRKYRQTKAGREADRRATSKYSAKNRVKKNAQDTAHTFNPELLPCVICGKLPTHRHHFDYSKPREIVYLCAFHHKMIHKLVGS